MKFRLALVLTLLLGVLGLGWAADPVDQHQKLITQLQQDWKAEHVGESAASLKKQIAERPESKMKDNGWLERSMTRIKNLFIKPPEMNIPKANLPSASGLSMGTYFIWILLIGGAATLLFFALRNVSWDKIRRGMKSRRGSLVEDDEPALSSDEWQQRALDAIGRGDFRTATRCYYLGTLVAMDDRRMLRFIRWETNWEHLGRYEGGPHRLPGVDLRVLTRRFDQVWYGYAPCTHADLEPFKAAYEAARAWTKEGAA